MGKNLPAFVPQWIKTFSVPRVSDPTDIHYINIGNSKTLAWTAQMGCIEIHPFLHCYPEIQQPTSIVFDLDPGPPADIIDCCRVALRLRDFFAEHGLRTLVKVSGSKGLQVYVPLNTRTTYAITQPFAKRVAEILAERNPELILSEMARDLRPGKVFIDWSQNAWHKTTVGATGKHSKLHLSQVNCSQALRIEQGILSQNKSNSHRTSDRVGSSKCGLIKVWSI